MMISLTSITRRLAYSPRINRVLAFLCKLTGIYELPVNFPVTIDKHIKLKANQTSHLAKVLYYRGEDDFEYTPLFKLLTAPNKIFIDVGANIGYYSLLACNRRMQVYAFEPALDVYPFLVQNMVDNFGDKPVHPFHLRKLAVGNGGYANFEDKRNAKFPNTPNLSGTHGVIWSSDRKVEMFKLDKLYSKPHIIKIDVEGYEEGVLLGAFETIERGKPFILVENNYTSGLLREMGRHEGYVAFAIIGSSLSVNESEIWTADNLLFAHYSKFDKIKEFEK